MIGGFDPYSPMAWYGVFSRALGVSPPDGGGYVGKPSTSPGGGSADSFPTGPGTGTQNAAPTLPASVIAALNGATLTHGADTLSAPRPAQGQGLAQPDTYGGDEYAHAGWGTAQPFDYSTYHPQPHPRAPQYQNSPSNWESYWTWLGRYANPQQPGYHVGGRY